MNISIGYKLSKALHQLTDALNRLTQDDLEKIADETYNIEIRITRKRNREESPTILGIETSILVSKLTSFITREEAQAFLDENYNGNRKALELIAKNLDIPTSKKDKPEMLHDKIIESTVGARIRSQVIQGNNL